MYTLLKASGIKNALSAELPGFLVALAIAQIFYKWGSFSLELVGFLGTWWLATFVKAQALHILRRSAK
jgi:hypothetical protein